MRYLLIVLLVIGCTNSTDKDECNPKGKWKVTLETYGGDGCVDPGQKIDFEISVTKSDVAELDNCTGTDIQEFEIPETDAQYGLYGLLDMEFEFDGSRMEGNATFTADITESGEEIGSCVQRYRLAGKKL